MKQKKGFALSDLLAFLGLVDSTRPFICLWCCRRTRRLCYLDKTDVNCERFDILPIKWKLLLRMIGLIAIINISSLAYSWGALNGKLTITGNTFIYQIDNEEAVTGIIRLPPGEGPFPAVLISHGRGGTAANFSLQHAEELSKWGFACIGPDYTHAAGSTITATDSLGYSPENSRRARRCLEILANTPSVDMSRLAVFGHSMGSFVTCGLSGELPLQISGNTYQIKAACISAGGSSGSSDRNLASPSTEEVTGIAAPFLMFHGTRDETVHPIQSENLQTVLNKNSISSKRLLYKNVGHEIITDKQTDIYALMKAWFSRYRVLAFAGNTPPTIAVASTLQITGSNPATATVTVSDLETDTSQLTLQVFTTDDSLLPADSISLSGSGTNRTLNFTPRSGKTGPVDIALVISDGQLSEMAFMTVSIQDGTLSQTNFRPEISPIMNQKTSPGLGISNLDFSISDFEKNADQLVVAVETSNPILLPVSGIVLGGSGNSRTISLNPIAGVSGSATITVTVSDGDKTRATAFTLDVAAESTNSAPEIQVLTGEILAAGNSYGPQSFVIRDRDEEERNLTVTATSSNPTLIPSSSIKLEGSAWGRSIMINPASGQFGRATITISVNDGTLTSSTAFVLDVIEGNKPPTISNLPSYLVSDANSIPMTTSFMVGDQELPADQVLITAQSSNPSLLPASNIILSNNGATRTLTLSPISGITGATTVTLNIRDGDFIRCEQLLYVVRDLAAREAQFSRPRGVFVLDSAGALNYTTTFGKQISLRDNNMRPNYDFIDGYTLRVAWSDVESDKIPENETAPGIYDFFIIQNALRKLANGQRLSLIIVPSEPSYIASMSGVVTWTDGQVSRAVPWDKTLRKRRDALLKAMASLVTDGIELRNDPRLDVINPYLPGGFTGIRDPNSSQLRTLPDYSRENLLKAAQEELISLQNEFPGKYIQIGFWPVTDGMDKNYNNLSAYEWMRQQLLVEFNGLKRPRVGFFMENLAASRKNPSSDIFTGTPTIQFGAPLYQSSETTWNGFQMLGCWTNPFNDNHVSNNLYGSPNDALEYAYNNYRAEYFELYVNDIDNAALQASFRRWHDFYSSRVTTSDSSDEDGDGLPFWWERANGLSFVLNAGLDGSQGDPDADGISNLLEYSTGTNPFSIDFGSIGKAGVEYSLELGKTYLTYTFRRRIGADHIQYIVEVSPDLQNWYSGADYTEFIGMPLNDEDGITEWVTYRGLQAIEDGTGRLFMRLRVTTP